MQPTSQYSPGEAERPNVLSLHAPAVERVMRAMRARLSEPLALEEMAEIAHLSPFHFHRLFRSHTGIPPGEFLAALRLDAAKRLLLTTSLSVTDVCFELGYASLGTFTTRFTRLVGVPPQQLRQLADELASDSLDLLAGGARRAPRPLAVNAPSVSGTVAVPGPFAGLIFVGLFPRPIPQGRPVTCATLAAPGSFQLGPAPDGRYHLLAAALPWSPSALAYLLPRTDLLVGVAERPVMVRGGQASAPVELALRPLRASDPPILGVFPPLLAPPEAARGRDRSRPFVPTAQDGRSGHDARRTTLVG